MIVVAYAIAILLPLGFLYLIYAQDLYGQGKFRYVLLSFGWGLAAFGGAYGLATLLQNALAQRFGSIIEAQNWMNLWLAVLIAPIVEEVFKSLVLFFLGRRITYFVDGAIYGFAAGIAFSILENVLYLARGSAGTAVLLALLRVFSTCLLHGAASALVGTAVGRLRYGHGLSRVASAVLGWALAIGLHMGFNRLVKAGAAAPGIGSLLGAVGIGVGGAVLIIAFVRWGLAEEKRWIQETLGIGTAVSRVSGGEIRVVRKFEQIDDLLKPVVERFGEGPLEDIERFLLMQAKLGIQRKAQALTQSPAERQRLGQEIAALHEKMDSIRRQVGVYCMSFVRTIFPEDAIDLNAMLGPLVQQAEEKGMSLDDPSSLKQLTLARLAQGDADGRDGQAQRPRRASIYDLAGQGQDEADTEK